LRGVRQGKSTSTISVTHMPSFQCSLCRDTSSHPPEGRAGGVVAGITKLTVLYVTVILFRKHLGKESENTAFRVTLFGEVEVESPED
jgi:hypothetical protein